MGPLSVLMVAIGQPQGIAITYATGRHMNLPLYRHHTTTIGSILDGLDAKEGHKKRANFLRSGSF